MQGDRRNLMIVEVAEFAKKSDSPVLGKLHRTRNGRTVEFPLMTLSQEWLFKVTTPVLPSTVMV
jgi:hypothetical protein